MKAYAIQRRKNQTIVRYYGSRKTAQRIAWAMNDLCGNESAFRVISVTTSVGA